MKGLAKQARGAMETALILIGNEAKNHFVLNFRKGGFEDKTVETWKPRKPNAKRNLGRALLVNTGDLRRSIIRGNLSKTALSVTIKTDLKYAKVHNFGERAGRGKGFMMPKRQFIGDSYNLNEKVKKILVNRLDKMFKK